MAASFGSLINSMNIYVDTSRDLDGPGDNVSIQLAENSISVQDGQIMKLSMTEFNMYRNFYSVNNNNGKIRLTTDTGASELELTNKNYRSIGNVVDDFAEKLRAQLQTDTGVTCTADINLPADTELMNSESDRVMSVTLNFTSAHHLTVCRVQCFDAVSDSYALLGGNRIVDPASTDSSFDIDFTTSATAVVITGFYPAQRSTESHIFVRTDLRSNNIESASLSSATGPYQCHTLTSNILAKIPIDVEFCSMTQSGPHDEFFCMLGQRSLTSLRLFLTDSRGRPLGRSAGSTSKTAAGIGTAQSTLGNLSFQCTLRLDVIQKMMPNTLQTAKPPQPIPGRFSGPLLDQAFGKVKY